MAHEQVAGKLTAELGRHCNLSISEFDVLLHLRLHAAEETRIQDLRSSVALSQPALSRLVARLADRGLLERVPADDDGRAVIVRLTAAGEDIAGRAMQVHAGAVHASLTGRISGRDQEHLLRSLARIGAQPETRSDAGGAPFAGQ